jgi:hypothetical protein
MTLNEKLAATFAAVTAAVVGLSAALKGAKTVAIGLSTAHKVLAGTLQAETILGQAAAAISAKIRARKAQETVARTANTVVAHGEAAALNEVAAVEGAATAAAGPSLIAIAAIAAVIVGLALGATAIADAWQKAADNTPDFNTYSAAIDNNVAAADTLRTSI